MRPRLLDLFCGAGGAARGYHEAGFDVVGVDINPQPNYPYEFHRADAMTYPLDGFDAIHASPPCQSFTVYRNCRPGAEPRWPDLIEPTRQRLIDSGLPWVMENVPGAPMTNPLQLCGTSFGMPVRRHRLFESNVLLVGAPCNHGAFTERRFPGSSNRPNGRTVCNIGEYRVPLAVQKECMRVDWPMTLHELSESIPWAYTEYIGRQLMAHILEECGAIAERCEHPGCDSFGDHQDGTDERLWCEWHCPGAECAADREAEQTEVAV